MLTHRHLALLRAALQFFDEELSPHAPEMARPYFEDPLASDLTAAETGALRELLSTCCLRYACCDPAGTHVITSPLMETVEQAHAVAAAHSGQVSTVLLTPIS